jgi:hypothetical protein
MNAKQRRMRITGAAGLMLALWFALEILAVSPQLHQWLHKDSDTPNHQCFLVQLNKGSLLEASLSSPMQPPLWNGIQHCSLKQACFFPSFAYRVSPSRAPPFISSCTAVVG